MRGHLIIMWRHLGEFYCKKSSTKCSNILLIDLSIYIRTCVKLQIKKNSQCLAICVVGYMHIKLHKGLFLVANI